MSDQRVAYDTITACIDDDYIGPRIFNINAPGGCGKRYLLNGILAHVRGMGHKCIAAASSGIYSCYIIKGWEDSTQLLWYSNSHVKYINM